MRPGFQDSRPTSTAFASIGFHHQPADQNAGLLPAVRSLSQIHASRRPTSSLQSRQSRFSQGLSYLSGSLFVRVLARLSRCLPSASRRSMLQFRFPSNGRSQRPAIRVVESVAEADCPFFSVFFNQKVNADFQPTAHPMNSTDAAVRPQP